MKPFVSLLTIAFSYGSIFAQSDSLQANKTDSTSARYNFLIVDSRLQSQFAFWGRNFGQKIPLTTTSLMYYSHSGVWLSASNFIFLDETVPTQFGASLGYFKEVNERVDWHLSYTQFYIPSNSIPTQNRTQGYAQTTLGFDWGPLFSTLQVHALLNKQSDFFFTTSHSRYFQFNNPLWKKIIVSFEPKFSFTVGTHRFEYVNGLVVAPGGGGVITNPGSEIEPGKKFQPINWDFTFPVKFSAGLFSFEPSWKITAPLNANPYFPSRMIQIVSLHVNYAIPFARK